MNYNAEEFNQSHFFSLGRRCSESTGVLCGWRCTKPPSSPSTSTTDTPHSTSKFWLEVISSSSLIVRSTVTTTTFSSVRISVTTTTATTWRTTRTTLITIRSPFVWFRSFPQCSRYNLRRKVQKITKILNPFVGQIPVVVPPSKILTNISSRFQGEHCFDHFKVSHLFQLTVFCKVKVFDGNHDSIFEQVLVNSNSVLLWYDHFAD